MHHRHTQNKHKHCCRRHRENPPGHSSIIFLPSGFRLFSGRLCAIHTGAIEIYWRNLIFLMQSFFLFCDCLLCPQDQIHRCMNLGCLFSIYIFILFLFLIRHQYGFTFSMIFPFPPDRVNVPWHSCFCFFTFSSAAFPFFPQQVPKHLSCPVQL